MSSQRLQKLLAQAGITSRRKAEEMIAQGLVTINGQIAKLGDKAEWGKDAIKLNGKLVTTKEAPVYLAFHKPRGVISSFHDPEGRATLGQFLEKVRARVFPIGRLDFNSDGLLLLTNDGEMVEKIQKAENIARVYLVKTKGHPDREMISRLERGGLIGEKYFKPQSVRIFEEYTQKVRIQIVAVDNAAVDVKAFCESKGFLIEKITRQAIGHLTLHGLAPGEYRLLQKSQLEALYKQPELAQLQLDKEGKKLDKKAERAATRDEREEAYQASRGETRGPKPRVTIRPKFEDLYGKPGEKSDAAPRVPKQGSGWLDQGDDSDQPAPKKVGAGFKVHFSKRPSSGARADREERPAHTSRGPRPVDAERPPARSGDRPAWSERKPRGSVGAGRGPRPVGSDRPDREERPTWSERKPRGNVGAARGPRPIGSDRPARDSDRPNKRVSTTGGGYFKKDAAERPTRGGPRPAFKGNDRPHFGKSAPRSDARPARSTEGSFARPSRPVRSEGGGSRAGASAAPRGRPAGSGRPVGKTGAFGAKRSGPRTPSRPGRPKRT